MIYLLIKEEEKDEQIHHYLILNSAIKVININKIVDIFL
jgi:hypothetical protein